MINFSRFKCHKKCSRKAPPSCGLPPQLEKIFIDTLRHDSAGNGMCILYLCLHLPGSEKIVGHGTMFSFIDYLMWAGRISSYFRLT